MAMGEWLSVTSSRELNQRQIDIEADELNRMPEEEEEMVLIYQAKGLETAARALARQLISNKKTALDTLVREELGIDPDELGGSAWAAGGTSFGLFAAGAIFPVAPFFWLAGTPRLAGGSRLRERRRAGADRRRHLAVHAVRSGFPERQVGIGFAAAAVTYAIGKLIGVAITGHANTGDAGKNLRPGELMGPSLLKRA